MIPIVRGAAAAVVLALALSACGGGGDKKDSGNPLDQKPAGGGGSVVVGSANFPESQLLGEVYAQALEAKGVKVTRKFNIGSREVYYDQVKSGAITVMPEYNGALLTTSVDKESKAVTTADVNAALKAKLPSTLAILDSSQAEDKDSVTVNPQTAQKYNLKSIADLKPVAGQLTIGAASEFKTRQQGLIGLQSTYGLKFKKFQSFDANAQTTLVKLLKNNTIQAANLFTTDPSISASKFVVLTDPQNVFSAENVTPLIYKSGVDANAQATLNAVSAKLTTQDLLAMMTKLVTDKDDPNTVAKGWLSQAGLG
ncbi:ABC transporter substrate-binding protein [Actinoallomurus bryophytorum]|uniref:Osmoprotectant transport system substrate-binding protein n=1 Tax=Actinoallomurus bryophytorum TaxID=1490222 RepID=A0A543C182_9ACTN|nr:ABC transporter substrate-binding protein [Actinoallomurus bryophytorum]TQL90833.1 osmoprotectant transport system substrate-binding protein [Actinoallomurus bryophytorum]